MIYKHISLLFTNRKHFYSDRVQRKLCVACCQDSDGSQTSPASFRSEEPLVLIYKPAAGTGLILQRTVRAEPDPNGPGPTRTDPDRPGPTRTDPDRPGPYRAPPQTRQAASSPAEPESSSRTI
ncbi:hypothetical protein EYF80_020189 [Liparis tanakae]|uniref:Uncharacterized protein n=1 Tax=Liparis tanakae TaxID=230148 RepID=A0A4Z2HWZ5_9TELE|nr:hypothetical protein EYF80_020189 [Liparis tanakae]